MKRIVVIMVLLSSFLWCSTSVFPYTPMDSHIQFNTQVTPLADGYYRYDYAVTNVDQGGAFVYQGLDVFVIQVPLTAGIRKVIHPALYPTPLPDGYWIHGTIDGPLTGYPWSGELPQSGFPWLWITGMSTFYPQGTTAHSSLEANAPLEVISDWL